MSIHVLIADDSAATRQVIERTMTLVDANVLCHHASNGHDALKILQAHWIDLIFADLHMPEMGGRELLRQVRANDVWKQIPVAIVTSERSKTTEIELFELGANFYHQKPITPESLKDVFGSLREMLP